MQEQNTLEVAKQLVEIGKKNVVQLEVNGIPVLLAQKDMELKDLSQLIDSRAPQPHHIQQNVTAQSADSFIEYFNRFATENSTIFVDIESGRFVGILDYHTGQTNPEWKRHTVEYKCPKTVEWNAWLRNNDEKMSQTEFALFIEDHQREITHPNGGEMLKIATTLKAKSEVDFRSSIRLEDGQTQFTYVENLQGSAGSEGQFTIPEVITLALRPFQNGTPYAAQARFRYRKNPSGLVLWYTLQQPHLLLEDAVNDVYESIKSRIETGYIIMGEAC